jgi:tRNA (guanine-N7-)-methyltransferase
MSQIRLHLILLQRMFSNGRYILEIGFGMGETTAHIAQFRPKDQFLAIEVHEPGVGALLKRIGEMGLNHVGISSS